MDSRWALPRISSFSSVSTVLAVLPVKLPAQIIYHIISYHTISYHMSSVGSWETEKEKKMQKSSAFTTAVPLRPMALTTQSSVWRFTCRAVITTMYCMSLQVNFGLQSKQQQQPLPHNYNYKTTTKYYYQSSVWKFTWHYNNAPRLSMSTVDCKQRQ